MRIELSQKVQKWLNKADKTAFNIITKELKQVQALQDPRLRGKPLKGNKAGLWRYRAGNYRILCEIKDDELIILALEVGHRKDVYEKRI